MLNKHDAVVTTVAAVQVGSTTAGICLGVLSYIYFYLFLGCRHHIFTFLAYPSLLRVDCLIEMTAGPRLLRSQEHRI
jgi:hypothetical protein